MNRKPFLSGGSGSAFVTFALCFVAACGAVGLQPPTAAIAAITGRFEAASPVSRRDRSTEHLYVAIEQLQNSGGGQAEILRFPVDGWKVAGKPDLTYPGYAGPIAFDASGNLYAGNGMLQPFDTIGVAAFRVGSTKPFASYPAPRNEAYVTSITITADGYLAMGFVGLISSSVPATYFATYKIGTTKVVDEIELPGTGYPQPVEGMAAGANGLLYASCAGAVREYVTDHGKLKHSGTFRSDALQTPGGLAVSTSGSIYVVDATSGVKPGVLSFPAEEHGLVDPTRSLIPIGPDQSNVECCGGEVQLSYQPSLGGPRLYLPFFTRTKTGGAISGVYEFNRTQDGKSRAIQALPVKASTASENPYVVEAAVLGP